VEALNGEDSEHWKKAMDFEFQSLQYNKIWILTLPFNHKPMNCKWIFKIKYNVNGFVVRHKAHLMAKGFTQVEGFDFNKSFSLVARMESIEVVFVVATIEDF
jgi:hypothetical protein